MNLTENKLNQTEQIIHQKLTPLLKENPKLKIAEAAMICNVSPSKISKYVKKLGFENFKQYRLHFSGQVVLQERASGSDEITRVRNFLEHFDETLVNQFLTYFSKYEKIVLYGLGPTFILLEYFTYKLSFMTEKKIFVTQEENYIERLADEDTLLIIFSVTGAFASFDNIYHNVNTRGGAVLLVLEEYNTNVSSEVDNIIYLTSSAQNPDLLPYEKTRSIFLIYIEEIVSKLMVNAHQKKST